MATITGTFPITAALLDGSGRFGPTRQDYLPISLMYQYHEAVGESGAAVSPPITETNWSGSVCTVEYYRTVSRPWQRLTWHEVSQLPVGTC
jgi:hypothetical protein